MSSNIAMQRLYSQQLEQAKFTQPGEVVGWLGAVQGQDYAGAKWSVGLRLPGSTDANIEQALTDKAIVRTWAMRGTLHFVAAQDLRWMLELLGPRIIAGNARRYRELELDERTLARSNAILAKALEDGKQLDRTTLRAILEQNRISTEGQRAVYMLQRASLDGLICQGVMRRNNPSFMLLDKLWLRSKTLDHDQAVAELARRYFTSRSPVTLQDFVWWSGLGITEARAGLEAIQSWLSQETIDGQTYWRSRDKPAARAASPTAYFLPGFDEYLLSYRDRSASIDAVHWKKLAGKYGMLSPTLVVDGHVVGTWKRTFKKGEVLVAASPFAPLTKGQERAIAVAARRFGEFLGMPVKLP